jgi:chromosome segregation ATPase
MQMKYAELTSDYLHRLEAEEKRVSKLRADIHRRIEFVAGGAAAEPGQITALNEQERELSERRKDLHRRIDQARAELGLPPWKPQPKPERERWY